MVGMVLLINAMNSTDLVILIYYPLIAVYGFAEIFIQLKYSGIKSRGKDKDLVLILIPFYLSIYLPPGEHVVMDYKFCGVTMAAGFIILVAGVIVRIAALVTLKSNFSVRVEAREEGYLVTNGLYRHIRHPLYLGIIMLAVSGSLIFACIFDWIFVILTITEILRRIRKEEEFLTNRYTGYEDYRKHTHKLIPYLY